MDKQQKLCVICGKPLPPKHSKYCSDECRKTAEKQHLHNYSGRPRGNQEMRWQTTCIDCGMPINRAIKSIRCPACQRAVNKKRDIERKKRGPARPLGSVDKCQRCGKEYIVTSGLQKYCPDCREEATRESVRAHKREYMAKLRADPEANAEMCHSKAWVIEPKHCAFCGKKFVAKGRTMYCSDECRKAANRAYWAEYDKRNADKRAAAQKKRQAALTPEDRERINAMARENYRKRKEKKKSEDD